MIDTEACERARLARDPRFDGLFFTGVLSTGIFCRPICPAPQPKAANVIYFPTAAAAMEAGLRPCLRCRPEAAPGTPAWNGTSTTVARAIHLIRQGALDEHGVEALAGRLGLGGRQLRRLFRQHLGTTPVAMANAHRVLFAKQLLEATDWPVTQVAFACGFGSLRRFNAVFRNRFQQTPSALRRAKTSTALPPELSCTLTLSYRPPFDFASMLSFFRQRAIQGTEKVAPDSYHRTIRTRSGMGIIHIRPLPGKASLELKVTLSDIRDLLLVVEQVRRLLDLDANMAAVQKTLSLDPLLKPLVHSMPGIRLPGAWDPFETAVRAIVGQQISVKAARTVVARIVQRFGPVVGIANEYGLCRVFPSSDDLARADLNGLGLTAQRVQTLKAFAQAVASGEVRLLLETTLEDFVRQLTRLPGIGPWTAHYIALRGLNEPDAFPASDLGLLRALAAEGLKVTPQWMRRRSEAWRPWRGYAANYLWNRPVP